mgnify:CR=1 FL=1
MILIVASIGTGTAFVHAKGGVYTHLCGTGVGGGTLKGLAVKVLGVANMREFDSLAMAGDCGRVDLLIGDFVESYGILDPEITASNLARLDPTATDADWAAGLANLVLQVIGTMSLLDEEILPQGLGKMHAVPLHERTDVVRTRQTHIALLAAPIAVAQALCSGMRKSLP